MPAIKKNVKKKKDLLATVITGLGLGLAVVSGGFVGTHEKLGDNWLKNADYNNLKNSLIEKQEKNSYITIQEWQLLTQIYDKEIKKGVSKKNLRNLNSNQLVETLNKEFKK